MRFVISESSRPPELFATVIRVRDLERSVEWYSRVLGLVPGRRDVPFRVVDLQSAKGQRISLRELSADDPLVPLDVHSAYLFFVTPSADSTHEWMLAQGEKVGPLQDMPGIRHFWVSDPDGHEVRILEFIAEWGP
jgi:catechol 2,3-dioxygenase-like lactoylglutathione lyase family enzyme